MRFLRRKAQCLCHFEAEEERALLIPVRGAAEALFSTTHVFTRVLAERREPRYLKHTQMSHRQN